jgi:YVTN family beta-propeller protein
MRNLWVKCAALVLACAVVSRGQSAELLQAVQTIELPGVKGRIDHLSPDMKGKRLFVAALGNNTVEVIDLAAGKVIHQIGGLLEPQGILFLPDVNQLVVANGQEGSVRVFNAVNYEQQEKIEYNDDADNLRYDPDARRIYVGYGAGGLGVIDAAKIAQMGRIPLGVHPESFQLERKGKRIFVNLPDAQKIAVIDREKNAVIAEWPMQKNLANFPMTLDEENHRLFVGCRKPAKVVVLDTESGKPVTEMDCAGDTDDLFYDAKLKRIYVACGEGFVDVFGLEGADRYKRIAHIPTAKGARTALFVPDMDILYLAVPARGKQSAEIRVFKTRP